MNRNKRQILIKKIPTWVLISLALILALGLFLRVYKLGQQSLIADEYLGMNISYGYNQTGEWTFWDFNKQKLMEWDYNRAQIYYWQVAQVFNFFEPTEANSRLISVMWGMIGLLSIFLIAFWVTKNYVVALISTLLLAVSVSSLTFDRKLRMYSMFVPIYLWLSYFLYMFIESQPKRGPNFIKNISEKTKLNWNFFLPAILLGLISVATHLLAVNIGIVLLVYLLVMAWKARKKEKAWANRYSYYLIVFLLLIIIGMNFSYAQLALKEFSFWINNWSYLSKASLDYSHMFLAGLFLVAGIYWLIKNNSKKGIWIVVSYLTILFLAIMVWRRSAGHQYLLFTQPFKIMIIAGGIYFISDVLSKEVFNGSRRWFWGLITTFLILLINFSFFSSKESFYAGPKSWSHTNYREGYDYYHKHRKANSAVIIRPAVTYYLKGVNTDVIEYNEDDKLQLEEILSAQSKYDEIWFIYSKDTYVSGDAKDHIRENFELIETKYTNKKLQIRRWQKEDTKNNASS